MTAKRREAKPRMQHNASTTKTNKDFEPAGFITDDDGFDGFVVTAEDIFDYN